MDFPKISSGAVMAYLAMPTVVGLVVGGLALAISKIGQNVLNKGAQNEKNSVQEPKSLSNKKVKEENNSSAGVLGWAIFSGCLLAGLAGSLSLVESLRFR